MKPAVVIRTVLLLGAALVLLVARQKDEGPLEKVGRKADEAARRAADSTQDAARMVGKKIERTGETIQDSAGR
jgi:hypothetical protein